MCTTGMRSGRTVRFGTEAMREGVNLSVGSYRSPFPSLLTRNEIVYAGLRECCSADNILVGRINLKQRNQVSTLIRILPQ